MEDELILQMVEDVTADVLMRLGDDEERRYQFFKAFVELANRTVAELN